MSLLHIRYYWITLVLKLKTTLDSSMIVNEEKIIVEQAGISPLLERLFKYTLA